MACIISIPDTGGLPCKGIASRDKADAPGWKHPRIGWLFGVIKGILFDITASMPPLALILSGCTALCLLLD